MIKIRTLEELNEKFDILGELLSKSRELDKNRHEISHEAIKNIHSDIKAIHDRVTLHDELIKGLLSVVEGMTKLLPEDEK